MTSVDCSTSGPPATAVWYDLDPIVSEVLAILRLTDADVDVERITTLVPVAAAYIDTYVDRPQAILGPPPPALVAEALRVGAVILYRFEPSPFITFHEAMAPVRLLVDPYKERTGVA